MTTNAPAPFHMERRGAVLHVGFTPGVSAHNPDLVRCAYAELTRMAEQGELLGGGPIGVTGPASLPVMVTIAHAVLHRFTAVAVFDPKIDRFVVAATHDPAFRVGQELTANDLTVTSAKEGTR